MSVHVYKQEFETLLKKSTSQVNGENSRVIVLSIPDYGYTPFGLGNQKYISAKIDEFNSENRNIALAYNVSYVDITPLSRRGITEPELVAGDHLHPSANQYSLWVSQLLPVVIGKLN
ncbi:MAG: hypothetical protein HC905_19420 [Bacteroidales bacterium]|nr:hypothetical protein [Bacteroidales bacterium]